MPYVLRRADLVLPVASPSGSESPTMHSMSIYAKALSTLDNNPADITVTVSNNNTDFISGRGSVTDPYTMVYIKGRELNLTYTFTNRRGAGTAYNFNVATNYLPIGVEASIKGLGEPCAIGTSTIDLSDGQSCSVVIKLPHLDAINSGFLDISGQFLTTNVPFSYTDDYYGFVLDEDILATRYSVIYANWLKGFVASPVSCQTIDNPNNPNDPQLYNIKLKTGFSSSNYGVSYPITIKSFLNIDGTQQGSSTCKINSGQSSCEFELPNLPVAIPGHKSFTAMINATDANGNVQRMPYSFSLGELCKAP